ncbi:hypothetical protein ACQR3P_01655 [Rhodococcus sp. IEGM1300]
MFDTKYRDQRGKIHGSEQHAEEANTGYVQEEKRLNEGNLCRADIFIVIALLILSLGIFIGIPKAIGRNQTMMAFQMFLVLIGSWGAWGLMVWKIPVFIRLPLYIVVFVGGLFYLSTR